jgi:hypothetical protein
MECHEKNDRRVQSWDELHSLLYTQRLTPHGRYRADFVYRGTGDKCWNLDTSLQRLGSHYPAVERPLLHAFEKYARPGQIASDALLFRLAVAQHYGLPTRALDWTFLPRVALHFATFEEQHFDKDAAIWCVNVARVRQILPEPLKTAISTSVIFSVEMLAECKTLSEFDQRYGRTSFPLFFEPPPLDDRIVNQGAILSIMPGSELDLREFLIKNDDLFWRIIIPKEIKWEIRDKLDQDNVTERMLFPGLAGTSIWLKRVYGLGPMKQASASEASKPQDILTKE